MTISDQTGAPITHDGVLDVLKEKLLTALRVPLPSWPSSPASIDRTESAGSIISKSFMADEVLCSKVHSPSIAYPAIFNVNFL